MHFQIENYFKKKKTVLVMLQNKPFNRLSLALLMHFVLIGTEKQIHNAIQWYLIST